MIRNTAILAATVATALMMSQPSAEAGKVGVTIGFGTGYWHHGYYDPAYDPYYEPAYSYQDVLPRWRVVRELEHRGYYNIHRLRLRGGIYKVKARKHGRHYRIRVDAYSGQIISRRRI